MSEYTCNAIGKVGGRNHFCDLPLGHYGDHQSADTTWPAPAWDDDDV